MTGADDRLTRGRDLFYAGRFADALGFFEEAAGSEEDGEGTYYLGATLERLGRLPEADAAFAQAAAMDPEWIPPVRVTDAEFDRLVKEILAELPAEIQDELDKSCTVLREDFPAEARVRREGIDPLTLGECMGEAEYTRSGYSGPTQVILYRRNLEKVCADRRELEDEVRITVLHEVGHALGLNEAEVAAWGLA